MSKSLRMMRQHAAVLGCLSLPLETLEKTSILRPLDTESLNLNVEFSSLIGIVIVLLGENFDNVQDM